MPANTTSPTLPAELRAHLDASRRALLDAIAGLDEEGFRTRPSTQPAISDLLADLLASEDDALRHAVRGDASAAVPRSSAARMATPQIIHGLLAQRRDTLRALQPLTPEELAREADHTADGGGTVASLFQRIAGREVTCAAEIRTLRGAGAP